MNINDIVKVVSSEKANNLLNGFIQSILLGRGRPYEVDESVLRGENNRTGVYAPAKSPYPEWITPKRPDTSTPPISGDFDPETGTFQTFPRDLGILKELLDLKKSPFESDACAECRRAQMRPGAPKNIADPCTGVCG